MKIPDYKPTPTICGMIPWMFYTLLFTILFALFGPFLPALWSAPVGIQNGGDLLAIQAPSPSVLRARERLAALEVEQDALMAKRSALIDQFKPRLAPATAKKLDAALADVDQKIAAKGREIHEQQWKLKHLTSTMPRR